MEISWPAALILSALMLIAVVAPGASLLKAAGVPWDVALPAGPAVTILVVGMASALMRPLGIAWTPVSGWTMLIWCTALGIFLSRRRGGSAPGRHTIVIPALPYDWHRLVPVGIGVALAAVFQLVVLIDVMGSPERLLQNHDAMFHLNLIEETYRSGNASPLSAATPLNGGGYYPNTWHTLAVLLRPALSTSAAFNVMLVLVGTFLMPFVLASLTRAAGGGTLAVILAPVLGCATAWFPGFMLTFNAQVPAAWAIATALGAVAAVLTSMQYGRIPQALGVALAGAAGTTMAHAGAGQWLVIVTLLLAAAWMLTSSRWPARPRQRGIAAAAIVLVPLAAMTRVPQLRAMGAYTRSPKSVSDAVAEMLWLNPIDGSVWDNVVLVALALIGLIVLLRSRRVLLPVVWLTTITLSAVTALPEGPWWALTGGWWRDNNRYLATLALLSGCLAAIAIDTCLGAAIRRMAQAAPERERLLAPATAFLLVLMVAVPGTDRLEMWTRRGYDETALIHPSWVSSKERSALEALSPAILDDAVVYGVPSSGAALVPVLSDGGAFVRIDTSRSLPHDQKYLADHFSGIGSDPHVCEIIKRNGGDPLYYEDTTLDHKKAGIEFPGFQDVDTSRGFEPVAQLGSATLWRITACDVE